MRLSLAFSSFRLARLEADLRSHVMRVLCLSWAPPPSSFSPLPACRRLLFPFPRATKEIGDVCTQAIFSIDLARFVV